MSVLCSTTRPSNLDYSLSEGTVMGDLVNSTRLKEDVAYEERPQSQAMINMLPDEALLEIFHFYKDDPKSHTLLAWSWIRLIHVCRRWRHIIFGSPRRLDLRLVCSDRTPTRSLDIWPPLPIVVGVSIDEMTDEGCLENIMMALERRDRISLIYVSIYGPINSPALERLMTAMHGPFPVLTRFSLYLSYNSVSMPVLPETFLGGSAPNLDFFQLRGIPFPTFPKFILSSIQIRNLTLGNLPDSDYISPESMVTCLAALPNLEILHIGFRSPLSRPVEIHLRPLKRTVLPALISHHFEGVSEYFEDFVAQIDTPKLELLIVSFFMDLIFDLPQLRNFVIKNCLTQRAKQASIGLTTRLIEIIFVSQSRFELRIKCNRLDWQLSSITQIFTQQLPFLSHVKHFEISEVYNPFHSIGLEDDPDMDPSQWLELFHLLISVQSLNVSLKLVHRVAAALKGLTGEMVSEVLPALRTLSLEGLSGPVQDEIKSFVTARQLTNHTVVIQPWERPEDFPMPLRPLAELEVESQPKG